MLPPERIIQDNVARVRQRIQEAAARGGRSADDVLLVAVTKYVDASVARCLVQAGCRELGESRPQELWRKSESLAGQPVRWHLIGHLQRNKVDRTLPLVSLLHSLDSQRLLAAIGQTWDPDQPPLPVLIEINISGDEAKHGFTPEQIEGLLPELAETSHVQIRGLMAMTGLWADHDQARRQFAALRELRDRLRPACPDGVTLDELSMGMSRDYEAAIQEGATIVRVGSALVEGLPRSG